VLGYEPLRLPSLLGTYRDTVHRPLLANPDMVARTGQEAILEAQSSPGQSGQAGAWVTSGTEGLTQRGGGVSVIRAAWRTSVRGPKPDTTVSRQSFRQSCQPQPARREPHRHHRFRDRRNRRPACGAHVQKRRSNQPSACATMAESCFSSSASFFFAISRSLRYDSAIRMSS
jgi:hypothetical protein